MLRPEADIAETAFVWAQVAVLVWAVLLGSIRFNMTTSLPKGIYLLYPGELSRGGVVLSCFPEAVVALGRARGYHPPGRCPNGSAEVLKKVAALPGDAVAVDETGIHVNGILLERTRPMAYDSRGRRMPKRSPDPVIVGPSEVWFYSDYIDRSWDSRYFGPVELDKVRARAGLLVPLP